MSSDMESRFGHLLQPIRDLAQNWHIDLASELEDYLHELERLTVNIDSTTHSQLAQSSQHSGSGGSGGAAQLNFVEAALLIQGSACVYSKKVEYLYSLLYSTLDVVIEQRRKDARKQSSINASGQDDDAVDEDDRPLLPLDSIQEASNIDMDERATEPYAKARRATLLYRLPAALRQRTGRGGAGASDKQEGCSFRISECTVHSSGALLLEERDNALLDANLRRISADVPFGSPAAAIRAHRESLHVQPTPSGSQQLQSAAAEAVPQELDFNDHDGFDDNDDDAPAAFHDDLPFQQPPPLAVNGDAAFGAAEAKAGKAVRFASDGHLCSYNELSVATVDPYTQLDPFDASYPTKPFKRGKTTRVYREKPATAGVADMRGLYGSSGVYAAVEEEVRSGSVRVVCHAEFAELFVGSVTRRRQEERKRRKRDREERERQVREVDGRHVLPQHVGAVDDAAEDDAAADLFDGGDGGAADEWDEPDPLPSAEFLPPALSFLTAASSASASSDDYTAASQTYEDLCRQHLDAYLASAEQSVTSSSLQARVREWQDKLEPILEEEDSHPNFDIRHYGDRMLQSLEEAHQDGQAAVGELVAFEYAVRGVQKWEVCRLFLATLQLANNGNVEIDASTESSADGNDVQAGGFSDVCVAMGSLTVRVLSRQQQTPKDRLEVGWLGGDAVIEEVVEDERAEEEEAEVEEDEARRRKTRKQAMAGTRALQPVDGNTRANRRHVTGESAEDTAKPVLRARRVRV